MSKRAKQAVNLDFLQGDAVRTDLSGLFADAMATEAEVQRATMVPVERLLNNPYQPRLDTNDEALDELAQVISAQGFQGVLVARPAPKDPGFYQITAGHRRREAAKRAGVTTIPTVVREFTDEEMATIAITENIQREDLTPLEEGRIFLLMAEEMGYTHEQVAREIGRKRGYVENRLRLARATPDVQELVKKKPDSIRSVATLVKVKEEALRTELIEGLLSGSLTVEDLSGYIEARSVMRQSERALAKAGEVLESTRRAREKHAPSAGATEPQQQDGAATVPLAEVSDSAANMQPGAEAPHATNGVEGAALAAQASLPLDDEERSRIRIGSAKLATALRNLNTYREQTKARAAISRQERVTLGSIKSVVDALYERYGKEELSS